MQVPDAIWLMITCLNAFMQQMRSSCILASIIPALGLADILSIFDINGSAKSGPGQVPISLVCGARILASYHYSR